MFEFAPDYSSYSTTELLNSLSLVDRVRFAGRLADIRAELARRGVLYEETREEVNGKTQYKVRLLKTVPSETLSKQWQKPSHTVEIGNDEDFDFGGALTVALLMFAMGWWFWGWQGTYQLSLFAKGLIGLFIGFFLVKYLPKILQKSDDNTQPAQKALLLSIAVGVSVLPFALSKMHAILADSSRPSALVLEIYNGKDSGCYYRMLLELNNGQLHELCNLPSNTFDYVRPNEQVQILQRQSIFGFSVDGQKVMYNQR